MGSFLGPSILVTTATWIFTPCGPCPDTRTHQEEARVLRRPAAAAAAPAAKAKAAAAVLRRPAAAVPRVAVVPVPAPARPLRRPYAGTAPWLHRKGQRESHPSRVYSFFVLHFASIHERESRDTLVAKYFFFLLHLDG